LGLDQKDLAAAAQVTESYISQLLTRKKAPPAPDRTDIYEKISSFLKLPGTELTKLAEAQRLNEAKRRVSQLPEPLFRDFRELLLRKCAVKNREEVRRIFEKDAFGELERLVTQKILESAQRAAREELQREERVRQMAQASGHSYQDLRVAILEFLDTDILHVSAESCVSFLEPTIDSWDINLSTFSMEVTLNRELTKDGKKRFDFTERQDDEPETVEPGFRQFLEDRTLSGLATEEEIAFLGGLKFQGRRPSPLYYYRELQNLRDPLHFVHSDSSEEPSPEGGETKASRNDQGTS
jgi:transcriptional regulator with XRE-family HTH domain